MNKTKVQFLIYFIIFSILLIHFLTNHIDKNSRNVIVQYGYFTPYNEWQFRILCLTMIMLHKDELYNVDCIPGYNWLNNMHV